MKQAALRLIIASVLCCTSLPAQTSPPASQPAGKGAWDVPEAENIKSKDSFGAQLWFTDASFAEAWSKPQVPQVEPIKIAKRGQHYMIAVIFAGAKADASGNAKVRYDYHLRGPDQKTDLSEKNLVAWHKACPAAKVMQLAEQCVAIEFDPKDPAGHYDLDVTVRDEVTNVSLSLHTSFDLK